MIKNYLVGFAVLFTLSAATVRAQDVAVISVTAPVSGCNLTSAENVVIRIFNYGPTDLSGTNIPVSYSLNGGPAVNEVANFPSFLANSTVTYTFTTTADLSVAGTYTISSATNLAGDINTTNDAFTGYTVTNTAPSVGGTVAGGTNVCISGNSGNLTLTGNTGNVLNWEYSTDGGSTWVNISNTTTNQSYSNISVPTQYRATVQNGACPIANSSIAAFTIDPVTVGGTVASSATVCTGASGNLTLSGKTGNVQYWEFSTNGGATWTSIANTTTTQSYTGITTTTRYRANVMSGACPALNSSTVILTVSPATVGGTLAPASSTVCSGSNSGTITLSGHTGTITRWEYSTNGGASWTNIANTTTTQSYTNLTGTRLYRALVRSNPCSSAYSATATVTVSPASIGGTISGSSTVCSGSNSGTLTLSGEVGSVSNWEFSTDGGTTWTPITNTTNSESYTNLTVTTEYRAVVQNGSCTPVNSSSATITIDAPSVGGTLASDATVCASSNNGIITLTGNTGTITDWEFSTDNGNTWSSLANTANTYNYSNLTDTTLYRAVVQNGSCSPMYSDTVTITVDPVTDGGTVNSGSAVCSGLNSGVLTISGSTGAVQNWEYSTDNGSTWVNIVNTTTSQAYNNIATNTIYRALLKSGVCAAAYSGTATLTVDQQAVGGTTYGTTTVCQGSNSGAITLVGYSSVISGWESSTDGGLTWVPEPGTSSVFNYSNLSQTTSFHAITSSGICPNDTSTITVISVDQPSVGGVVAAGDTVCAGANAGTLTLSGQTGNVLSWEYSTDNGTSWVLLSNTTTNQNYLNLQQSTFYRAVVKNGVCSSDVADSVYIKVDSVPDAGVVSSSAQVCVSSASGTLTLNGYTGTVVDWQVSADNGLNWTGFGNTTNTLSYMLLTDTTYYRAIVSGGVCGNDTSVPAIITVDQLSVGGTISMSDTVCASGNSAVLTITGQTGTVQGWEYSVNNGNSWIPLNNTTTSQAYTNLTQTTLYRATVKSGICPVEYADTAIIVVDPVTVAGIISSPAQLCISNANGTLNLSGYTGTITDWESSSDLISWTSASNATSSLAYSSLTDTTYYRAIISSGVCANDTTMPVMIGIDQLSVAGTLSIDDTVCAISNSDTLALTGYTGTVTSWEFSTNNGASWIPLTNTNDSLVYAGLSNTTMYHAIVKNGVCAPVYSNNIKITVDQATNAGIITGGTTGCESNNHGNLYLSNSTGTVSDWLISSDNGASWSSTGIDSIIYVYSNLADTTMFQAILQNGVCPKDTSAPVTVLVYPKPVVAFSVDTVCFRDTTHLVNLTTLSSGFISTFTWNYGDGHTSNQNQNYVYASADTFAVSLTAFSNFGCSDTATAFAIVKSAPSAVISNLNSLAFCPGGSTQLTFTQDTNTVFSWNSSLVMDTISVDSSVVITLMVTDTITGCSALDSVVVVEFTLDSISAGMDTTVSIGTPYMLNGYGNGTVSWTPAEFLDNPISWNPVATITDSTTFIMEVTDVNGCVIRDTVKLNVNFDYVFDVKNLITPNGDGMNDKWIIKNIESYPDNQVTVFNREGNVVFQQSGYMNDWEGTFNGKSLPDGAYFYIIKFDNSDKVLKGDINILSNK